MMLSAASAEVKTGLIGGGGGNDSVIAVGRSGEDLSIRGGDGNDSIDVIFSAGTKTTVIEGDGSTDGTDTIRIALGAAFSSNTINGGDGDDSIVLSGLGADGGGNSYLAGTGADTVFFQSAGASDISGATIKGGAGNDSILINAMSAGSVVSSVVYGQKGDDTITGAVPKIGSAGSNNLTIQGGTGAAPLPTVVLVLLLVLASSNKSYSESTLIRWIPSPSTPRPSAGGAARLLSCWIDITTGLLPSVVLVLAARFLQLVATLSSVVIRTTALRLASLQLMQASPLLVTQVSSLQTTPLVTCLSRVVRLIWSFDSLMKQVCLLVRLVSSSPVRQSALAIQTLDPSDLISPPHWGGFFCLQISPVLIIFTTF